MQRVLVGRFLFIAASFFRQGFFYSLNARLQVPLIAAARNERGLLAVACKPLLGRDSTTKVRKGG